MRSQLSHPDVLSNSRKPTEIGKFLDRLGIWIPALALALGAIISVLWLVTVTCSQLLFK